MVDIWTLMVAIEVVNIFAGNALWLILQCLFALRDSFCHTSEALCKHLVF